MSNKSLSRKKRAKLIAEFIDAHVKFVLAANLVANQIREFTNYVKELKFPTPKLAQGGIVNGNAVEIPEGEAIIPVKLKGVTPYDNDQYMFQND